MHLLLANVGLPLVCAGMPILILLLVPVVAIEATWYRYALKISWEEAANGSWKANLWSTLIGIPLALVAWSMAGTVGMGWQFALAQEYGGLGPPEARYLAVLLFIVAGGWVMDGSEVGIWGGALVMLLPAYLVSYIGEARQLKKAWPNLEPKRVYRQCWLAHLCTYALLYAIAIWFYLDAVERAGLRSLLWFPWR
jgi:hypothetical protein